MDTLTAIKARRSVKHYDPDFVIPKQDIDTLLEHAIESPTSFNIQIEATNNSEFERRSQELVS